MITVVSVFCIPWIRLRLGVRKQQLYTDTDNRLESLIRQWRSVNALLSRFRFACVCMLTSFLNGLNWTNVFGYFRDGNRFVKEFAILGIFFVNGCQIYLCEELEKVFGEMVLFWGFLARLLGSWKFCYREIWIWN